MLVLGVGNPSRGDDALGPLFIERLAEVLAREAASGAVELLTDFQLQIEHALELVARRRVVFVDASVRARPPFELLRVTARPERAVTTHALSPSAVLDTYQRLYGEPPEAWALAIRGERFELGEPLSVRAAAHLDAALSCFVPWLSTEPGSHHGRRLEIEGVVQGVGLRPWVYRQARGLGLTGEVMNTSRGVCIDAFGSLAALDALVRAVQSSAPAPARVESVRVTPREGPAPPGFRVAPSAREGEQALSLPPDLAVCDACRREVAARDDRRHAYDFTSCTACGPRFSIADALPFDRAQTSMSAFALCADCQREHDDPEDRRFHAQTLACARCGPRTRLLDAQGRALDVADAVQAAATLLVEGRIVAVQGLGAFHLVCDATESEVVRRLRERKRRDAQPFAVMALDLARAEAVAELDAALARELVSAARPIVLAPARAGSLAPEVNGVSARSGVLLPYTPLHQRLLEHAARPLVVTSGNPSGGPAVIEAAEALAALRGIADAFLVHDRPIRRRVEDSVIAASATGTRVLRRARGLAPTPIRLRHAAPAPVLAVGGQMKSTACVVVGDRAYLTPHLGDLGWVESERAWQRDVEGFERLLGVRAEVIAHDLHPEYASTRYALTRAGRHVGVQHHVAHVLATVAELGLDEPVIGVAFDGTGWGPDGTSWGGEILVVDGLRWTRASGLGALPLPGGERALREVWRLAFAALHEAFGAEGALEHAARFEVFAGVAPSALGALSRALQAGLFVRARGVGRWLDAVGALALGQPQASFDGHVPLVLEQSAAVGPDVAPYPVGLPSALALDAPFGVEHEIDLRPSVCSLARGLLSGEAPGHAAARFHATLVAATAAVVARVISATGLRRVVLTGGAFQNRLLESGLVSRLGPDRVAMAHRVPLNDGGLALGQAWAAVLASGDVTG